MSESELRPFDPADYLDSEAGIEAYLADARAFGPAALSDAVEVVARARRRMQPARIGARSRSVRKEAVMAGKRELIEPTPGDKRYVTRDDKGRFDTVVDVGRSLAKDIETKAKTTVEPGYGHKGDQKRK